MTSAVRSPLARRGFLARCSAAAAGLLAFPGAAAAAVAAPAPAGPDAWLERMTGKERVMLHAHQLLMPALVGARNILGNGRDAYGVPERESSVAVMTHGPSIAGLLRDDVWRRLSIGERYAYTDAATGAPATSNPFLAPQPGEPEDAVVPALIGRGVTFVVCNVAVRRMARRLRGDGDAEAIAATHAELVAGLVPGVLVVPDLFVAMSRAQRRGVSYIFIDA